jgi:hypothetical protein
MRRVLTAVLAAALAAPAAARADDQADAKAIIEQAIKAQGGPEKLEKSRTFSVKMKGKLHIMGMDLDITGASYTEPKRIRNEAELEIMGKPIKTAQVFTETKGFVVVNDMTIDFDKDVVEAAKEKMYAAEVGRLVVLTKDKEFKLSTLGESKVDGKDALGVRIEHKGRADITLYFDKKTHMLVKAEGREKDPQSGEESNVETVFGDYKDIDGVKVPHKITIAKDGKPFVEAELSDYKFEDKLDDSLFAKP